MLVKKDSRQYNHLREVDIERRSRSAGEETHLRKRHDGVASPAEVWELAGVVAEAHRPAVGQDAVLHLVLYLVEGGEIVSRRRPNTTEREKSQFEVVILFHFIFYYAFCTSRTLFF